MVKFSNVMHRKVKNFTIIRVKKERNESNMSKKVYIAMSADFIHQGHINIIEEGAKYGDVTIGLLTDEAIATYKRVPLLDYENRKRIFENIKNVTNVVKQETLDYTDNLLKLKPDYVIHGDDWQKGIQSVVRQKVIDVLAEWNRKINRSSIYKRCKLYRFRTTI